MGFAVSTHPTLMNPYIPFMFSREAIAAQSAKVSAERAIEYNKGTEIIYQTAYNNWVSAGKLGSEPYKPTYQPTSFEVWLDHYLNGTEIPGLDVWLEHQKISQSVRYL